MHMPVFWAGMGRAANNVCAFTTSGVSLALVTSGNVALIADHALTPREVDVLMAVTQDERPLKQIAEELGISMRMVQRHLSSIYQKTDTQTRAGLTKAFPST